jgi:hypothetical protein
MNFDGSILRYSRVVAGGRTAISASISFVDTIIIPFSSTWK